jgi:hypothetical protein
MKVATKALVCAAAVSAVEAKKASGSSSGLLTIEGAYNFVTTSCTLSKDIATYVGTEVGGAAWALAPPDVQKQVTTQVDAVWAQVETLRIQNGIPAPAAAWKSVLAEYSSKVEPLVNTAKKVVYTAAAPAQKITTGAVSAFESKYPESAGLLPDDVFDLLFTLFVLFYFVGGYLFMPVLNCFCCGACSKRKAEAPKVTATGRKVIQQPGKKHK